MAMIRHELLLILASFVCHSLNRRVHPASERVGAGAPERYESALEARVALAACAGAVEQDGQATDSLQSFLSFLSAVDPAAGFQLAATTRQAAIRTHGDRRAPPAMMMRGTMQPKPKVSFDPSSTKFAAPELPPGSSLPSLVVFDLDNTLWTPELYTLRKLPNYKEAGPPGPVAGEDVWLIDGAVAALYELAMCDLWRYKTKVAAASRTDKGPWARKLLQDFEVAGRPLSELIEQVEIHYRSKEQHFENLRKATGIPFSDMIFFDDSAGGKWGNCDTISKMGVFTVHCPRGLSSDVWRMGLTQFAELKKAGEKMGRVLRPELDAKVTKYFEDRGFGFVQLASSGEEIYFPRSALLDDNAIRVGTSVTVTIDEDQKYKPQCTSVGLPGSIRRASEVSDAGRGTAVGHSTDDLVTLPCFSMGMPFAGLLAHGSKTLETRNNNMFEGTEGQIALLHVARKTFEDGGKHRKLLSSMGLSDEDIDRLTALPSGFQRGNVVAVVELGETRLLTKAQRSTSEVQNGVVAYANDMGRYATRIERVEWLAKSVRMPGKPGMFKATVPRSAIPAGWLDKSRDSKADGKASQSKTTGVSLEWKESTGQSGETVFEINF